MLKLKKHMKMLIPIILILVIFVVSIIFAMNNKNIRISMREINYKNNSNVENLSKLCIDLIYTNQYDKKIQYFPQLMYIDNEFISLAEVMGGDVNINDLYDTMQNEYLFSYLYTNQFDEFNEKYVEIFPKLKAIGPNYEYIIMVINNENTTDNQVKVILEALQNNSYYIKDDPLKQIGNLNTQSFIYEKLGDFEKQNAVDKQVDDITLNLKQK